jgi:hypothetical protein
MSSLRKIKAGTVEMKVGRGKKETRVIENALVKGDNIAPGGLSTNVNAALNGDNPNLPSDPAFSMRNPFNMAPMKQFQQTPKEDEKWLVLRDLQQNDMIGPDKALGARTDHTESAVEYVMKKRDQVTDAQLQNLVLRSFDPMDPVQRATLRKLSPQIEKNKQEVFDMVMEQVQFRYKCMEASSWGDMGSGAYSMMERLVMMIGGGEEWLEHPLLTMAVSGDLNDQPQPYTGIRGLFSIPWGKTADETKAGARFQLAKQTIHLFPQFLKGYNTYQAWDENAGNVEHYSEGIGAFVKLCEKVVQSKANPAELLKAMKYGGKGAAVLPNRLLNYRLNR